MSAPQGKFRVALVQLLGTKDRPALLSKISRIVAEAAGKGVQLVALPECFNTSYSAENCIADAETIPGETTNFLAGLAKKHKLYIVGGSIPESADGKYYNTIPVFDPTGKLVTKHRKMHLFDVDCPGKISFKESSFFTPGNQFTSFETPFAKIGVGVCNDIRFPEYTQILAQKGCHMVIFPSAFETELGPPHWDLLARARAMDNQMFISQVSPARDETASYVPWGFTNVAAPWGNIIAQLDEKEGVLYTDIDLSEMSVRNQIPLEQQRRRDVYTLASAINK